MCCVKQQRAGVTPPCCLPLPEVNKLGSEVFMTAEELPTPREDAAERACSTTYSEKSLYHRSVLPPTSTEHRKYIICLWVNFELPDCTIKGLTNNQLEEIGCQIILGNTYHLALRPGAELIDDLGGLHKFMNWKRALLTDSGGFQMVSLLHLADITEQGVTFQSPVDAKPMLLTPEESIQIQNKIGADIIMALDDVVKTTITGPRIEEAMYRTLRWIDRCIAVTIFVIFHVISWAHSRTAHKRPDEQNLFGIVQGGLDPVLRVNAILIKAIISRDICVRGMVDRNLPGYAIGGLSGGEDKDSFWRVVAQCTAALPEDKPRYVMGVGYPLDIVVCSALGADMYDCVYPTRTARFGTALIPEGLLKLKNQAMANDERPIDPTCLCMVCKNYTRAYLHCIVTKDPMGSQLVSYHNLSYMMRLSKDLHTSIVEGRFPEYGDFIFLIICLYRVFYVCSSLGVISQSGFAMQWRLLVLTSPPAVLRNNRGLAKRNMIDEKLNKTN
ncbi:hypothetical protein MUK42_25132 [Musa troglodytarum]|uniref:Queuine tRNA-ribosyltransferase catalytic subunit 1 n=2 Tax=Magnoliopsida TaxID=3398 RepID=A0A9E7L5E2_9LILI|nr:hypothetical protein MUK42_25132 [Musa troglodytarum]